MSSHTEPLEQQAHDAPARPDRWTRFAPWFSWIAGLLGLIFAGAFVLQAGLFSYLVPQEPVTPPAIENPEVITSYETKFSGFDKDNHPYWVTAARGIQDEKNADIVHLETLAAQFANKAGDLYDLTANGGQYYKSKSSIDLRGNVVIKQGARVTARMPQAVVFIKERSLSTESAVVVNFGDSIIRSSGMKIAGDAGSILFFNGVHATFGGAAAQGGTTP